MLVGYARVSTQDQKPELQLDALPDRPASALHHSASNKRRFYALSVQPTLTAAIDDMRGGGTLVVWKLYRLARSMKQLFGEWVLVRESGRIGRTGRPRHDHFRSAGQAIDALAQLGAAEAATGLRTRRRLRVLAQPLGLCGTLLVHN